MHVPEPVMSLAVTTKKKDGTAAFSKALSRFQKEDPTFRVETDQGKQDIFLSGPSESRNFFFSSSSKRVAKQLLREWENSIWKFILRE